jgi:hypothetical protein
MNGTNRFVERSFHGTGSRLPAVINFLEDAAFRRSLGLHKIGSIYGHHDFNTLQQSVVEQTWQVGI